MDPVLIVVIVVVALGVVALVLAIMRSRARQAALRERFGSEYDDVVDRRGLRRGERELRSRRHPDPQA